MPPEELDRLMAELKAWCKEEHGRQKELAEELGVSEYTLSHWIAGRKKPSLSHYFALKTYLQTQRRRGSRGPKD